jgi:hypothetical protein
MADDPDWVYDENCWCERCVAYRAAHGGSPEQFVNQDDDAE